MSYSIEEARKHFEGGEPLKTKPLILSIQPEEFTRVPFDAREFWKDYFFSGAGIDLDLGRFEDNSTVSWCREKRGPGTVLWPCDSDAA